MNAVYAALCERYPNRPSGSGWVALDECPLCGRTSRKETDRTTGFSPVGFNCFACGEGGNLYELARLLSIPTDDREYTPRPEKPKPLLKHWQIDPDAYLKRYLGHPRRIEMWQEYRPFNLDTIAKWQLGVGVLPNSSCPHTRLIYPARDETGRVIAFRGRHLGCECAVESGKWLTSGGGKATLVGRELLRPGATVFVLEAPPDAWFLMQQYPDLVGIANTAGANTWRDEWTAALVESKPDLVIMAYDNDLAGMARDDVRKKLLAEWWATHPKALRPPRAGGWWVYNLLLKANLPVAPWDWTDFSPRWDMGDVLKDEYANLKTT